MPIQPGKHWQDPSMGLQVPFSVHWHTSAQSFPNFPLGHTENTRHFTAASSKGMAANHRARHLAIRDKINYTAVFLWWSKILLESEKRQKVFEPILLHLRSKNNREKSYKNPFFLLENEANIVRRLQLLKGSMEGWGEQRQNREEESLAEEENKKNLGGFSEWLGLLWFPRIF